MDTPLEGIMAHKGSQEGVGRRAFLESAGVGALALAAGYLKRDFLLPAAFGQGMTAAESSVRQNIVIVLADDMGYGDVKCYDPAHCKIPTPRIDALAQEGMRFTDAHTTSSVCSPSRYGLLTGRYHWRAGLRGALTIYHPPVIPPTRLTLPEMLGEEGYHTACIGKWHLGFNWPKKNGEIDFAEPVTGGPLSCGFDYYYGVDCPNYPPFSFIENEHVTALPTAHCQINKEMIVNHEGPMAPGWRFDQVLPTLVEKSVTYIKQQAQKKQPFFLYFALTSPHYPIAPSEKFKGRSGINALGDFIMETDYAVGQIADALDRSGVGKNTLLIFLTDNGHDSVPGLKPFEEAGHRISGPFRGHKFNIAEGGHRVPFVVRWPNVVKAGTVCEETITAADLMATCAAITGFHLPDSAGEDSTSILPLLRSQGGGYQHPPVVEHGPDNAFAITHDGWKLIWIPAKGGRPAYNRLYNLNEDPGELHDQAAAHPDIVMRLAGVMDDDIRDGRSTKGRPQDNDMAVQLPQVAQRSSPATRDVKMKRLQ